MLVCSLCRLETDRDPVVAVLFQDIDSPVIGSFRSLASLAVGEPIPLNQSADGDLVTGR
jgi:hypothetical protein